MRLTAAILCITLLCWMSPALAQESIRKIVVTGEGRVSTEPDLAIVSLGVTREARSAADAMRSASGAAAESLRILSRAGVEPRDIQTSALNLSPRWQRGDNQSQPRITGYVASNNLTIRVRDLDELGGLLDDLIGSSANTMNGLSFSVADPGPLEDQARQNAVKDAIAKAGILAEAANVELGPIQTITEVGAAQPSPVFRREALMATDVPIATGEAEIHAAVTIAFDIEDSP